MHRSKAQDCLDLIPLLFHTVNKPVPLTVTAYDQTFLALEVEGQVPFPKSLLGLRFDDIGRCKSLNSEFYF